MEGTSKEVKTLKPQRVEKPQPVVAGFHPIAEESSVDSETMKINTRIILAVYVVIIMLGVGTGYVLSTKKSDIKETVGVTGTIKTDKVAGSTDSKTFKDSALGVVEAGGLNGEGSHKLIRDGGPSQTAYLISSVVDLDEYVGKKVTVWGQTMTAKKVSWLMDVGKVELLSE